MKKIIFKKKWTTYSVVLIFFIMSTVQVSAANYITVATIGARPTYDKNTEPQELVNKVIAFWQRELDQILPDKPDLIVLPEVCDQSNAGAEYRRIGKNQIFNFFASVAKTNKCYIAYGTVRDESEDIRRNSCVLLDRNGNIAGIYDKNFPTIREMEKGIIAGKEAPVFQCDFGSVGMAICFDLNFDELRLQYAAKKPDIILFSSAYHGGLVQSTWAYTCRSYFIGAVPRNTPSEIRSPTGEVIASSTNYFDYAVARINLDCELVHLDYNWDILIKLKEKYGVNVEFYDPGKLGAVLLSSEDENINVHQMIKEFDIELLDDYFDRSREFRIKQIGQKL